MLGSLTLVSVPPQKTRKNDGPPGRAQLVLVGGPHRRRTLTMNRTELARIAQAMVAKNKGILAADESTGTIKKRFDAIKLESNEEHRRLYREMLFTAPGAAESISGVILYDET